MKNLKNLKINKNLKNLKIKKINKNEKIKKINKNEKILKTNKNKKYNLLCVLCVFFYDTFDKCGKISREIYV